MNSRTFHRVVVIGKGGFVGSAILHEINKSGIPAIEIGREDIDITSDAAVAFFTKTLKDGDAVVFAAGEVPVKSVGQFISNLKGLENFIEAIQDVKLSQFIYVSSDAVYIDSDAPITESSVRAPNSLHGLMHLTREIMLEQSSLRTVLCIVRPTLIYGMRDPHNGYGPCSFMRLAKENQKILLFGKGEERRDFIYISDVAKLVLSLIQRESKGTWNLASGETISFLELANFIKELTKSQSEIIFTPRLGPMPHLGYRPFDISKLREFCEGPLPLRIESGLTEMANEN